MASQIPPLPDDLKTLDEERLSQFINLYNEALGKLRQEQIRRKSAPVEELDPSDPVALKTFLVNLRDEVSLIKSSVISNPKPPVPVEFVSYVASAVAQEKQDKIDEKTAKWNSHPEQPPSWTFPQPNPKDPWLYYI